MARGYQVRARTVVGGGPIYEIVGPDGRVRGRSSSRELAEARADAMAKVAASKVRPCLTCRAPFRSEGPHNRMCPGCRTTAVNGADVEPYHAVGARF